ncbi:MAG: c-type cytochrome [Acidobacteria bacterium]|nr:c-type cytochrome [Acidobacteriota bacterium]
MKRWVFIPIVILVALAGFFTAPVRAFFLAEPVTMETKGFRLANQLGCFNCHGSEGHGGVANPGSESGEIPSWQGFSFMMSMKNRTELEEWILDGAPERLRLSPRYDAKRAEMAAPMPAYRTRISRGQLDALVAYYESVSGIVWPATEDVERGYKAAALAGCFSCHGLGGRLDTPNPDSMAGFIPAWNGKNFEHLVHSDKELELWIRNGGLKRLENHPIAGFFTKRQLFQMPAYEGKISEDDIQAILTYIRWLRDTDAPDHQPQYDY